MYKKRLNVVCLSLALVALASCGGGGDSGGATKTPVSPPSSIAPVSGGTVGVPVALQLDAEHLITGNRANNYFSYSGVADETLVVHAHLTPPLTDAEKSRCASNPIAYATQIHIYDSGMTRIGGACGEDLAITLPSDGLYIINAEFPSHIGVLEVATLKNGSAILTPTGKPSSPNTISWSSRNRLTANTFYNYYAVSLSQGDRILVDVVLDVPLTAQQKTRCASNPGTGATASSYDTQVHVYSSTLARVGGVCGEQLDFVAPHTANYIIHFAFGQQSGGYFNATRTR